MMGIIFSTEHAFKIEERIKTMTRRVIPDLSDVEVTEVIAHDDGYDFVIIPRGLKGYTVIRPLRPRYKVGGIYYIKEPFTFARFGDVSRRWNSARYMPKEYAKGFVKITAVKAERVQDITEADALAEGVPDPAGGEYPFPEQYCPRCKGEGLIGSAHPVSLGYMEIDCPECGTAVERFAHLWDSINAKRSMNEFTRLGAPTWASNPWVWAYTFEYVAPETVGDVLKAAAVEVDRGALAPAT